MIDKLYWSPSARADAIYSIFNEATGKLPEEDQPSMWDLLAFCVEYIGAQSVAIGEEEFQLHAQRLSRLFYSYHYNNPAELYGKPDKVEEKEEEEECTDTTTTTSDS